MKCTNKKQRVFQKTRKKKRKSGLFLGRLFFLAAFILVVCFAIFFFMENRISIAEYESGQYGKQIYKEDIPVDYLCVTSKNVENEAFVTEDDFHAAALFRLEQADVIYADDIHERLYPASTTKILTAYLAIKYGNLEDVVTVSENATGVPLDSSRAGLRTGDRLTLEDLLYGLLLPSGNDSAVAIAEHISGSESAFAELMNDEAYMLGATNSHFVNAHGYHNENHYTTAYDLYLILKECVKQDAFLKVISSNSYHTKITQKNGTYREVIWNQSNQYVNGGRTAPEGVMVIGGKTGTTDEAGACLVLYETDEDAKPYISIIMGAASKPKLYDNMTKLISLVSVQ